MTTEEKEQIERGTCTITMINRINNKIVELETILNGLVYMVTPTQNTQDKAYSGIFSYEEYTSIFENINKLKSAFFVYSTTPTTPTYLYNYKNANDTERIFVDIENMITDMKSRYRECGTFQCGEVNNN